MLDNSPLSDGSFANLSPSLWLVFSFSWYYLHRSEFLILMKSSLSFISFMGQAFGILSKKPSPCPAALVVAPRPLWLSACSWPCPCRPWGWGVRAVPPACPHPADGWWSHGVECKACESPLPGSLGNNVIGKPKVFKNPRWQFSFNALFLFLFFFLMSKLKKKRGGGNWFNMRSTLSWF